MALPSAIEYGQVKWQAVSAVADGVDEDGNPDAVPVSGEVTFTPSATVLLANGATPITVMATAVTYQLDSSGVLRDSQGRELITLVATDSEGITPIGWTWTANYRLNGGAARGSFSFALPAGSVVDLTSAAPVASSNGAAIIQGPPGEPGGVLTESEILALVGPAASSGVVLVDSAFGNDSTDATAHITAKLAEAVAAGKELFIPPGIYRITGQLRTTATDARIAGAGAGRTRLKFASGSTHHGLVLGPSMTFGGGGQGTGYDRSAGYVRDLSIQGGGRVNDANCYAALLLAGAPYNVTRVWTSDFGVGFDLTDNCYGAHFEHCYSNFGQVNVGIRLRTGNLSGQDLVFINCWFRGRLTGVHMDPFSAGYTFVGGQINAGHTLTADRDEFGCVTAGRDLELMVKGVRSTGSPTDEGNIRNVLFKSVNFEGMHRVHVLRTYEPKTGWAIEGCHLIPSVNAADESDAPLSVWKGTGVWNSSVAFRDTVIGSGVGDRWKGSNSKMINIDPYSGAWPRISEENTQGSWALVADSGERLAHDQPLMEQSSQLHYQGGALVGTGAPEGAVFARVGALYRRLDGGANTTLYVKQSGAGTNTGWIAK